MLRRRDVRMRRVDRPDRCLAAVVLGVMRFDLILRANTPTGGDMGSHVLIPAYLRDSLLPEGRLIGWSNDWYAGFPILYFYFPLPALTIVAPGCVLPYGVAFKIGDGGRVWPRCPSPRTTSPRSMGLARPVALVGGLSGAMFIFMESFTIFGGNTLSTLAGEYSFSWSFALSLVYLGMVIRNTREGRGFTVGPAVLLALTALSHLITTMVVVVASLPLLVRRKGPEAVDRFVGPRVRHRGVLGGSGDVRTFGFTTDMEWHAVGGIENVFPRELWPMVLLGAVGLMWAIARKATVGPAVVLLVVPVVGYYVIEYIGFRKLYNARLLPYWYYAVYLFAGVADRHGVTAVGPPDIRPPADGLDRDRARWGLRGRRGGGWVSTRRPGWARWNYTGYEAKDGWTEYDTLMQELDALPEGRVMWEANRDLNRYGTPMALMLTGYWSEGHPSMEGLLFESSITTPFHFLNAAEVSQRPSNPIPGLNYHRMDFERAEQHLTLFNVAYYVSFTEEATEAAADYGLEVLAEPDPFTIYAIPGVLAGGRRHDSCQPCGMAKRPFFDAALGWYDDIDGLDRWLAADGPRGMAPGRQPGFGATVAASSRTARSPTSCSRTTASRSRPRRSACPIWSRSRTSPTGRRSAPRVRSGPPRR